MEHLITFYPVGNGDTSQIVLHNGKRILMDFRHQKKTEDGSGPEVNLKALLAKELKDAHRDYFDVVAFTHSDKDHIENSTEFFELRHAAKYQGNGRIKIDMLWVPAAMIVETAANSERSEEFAIWRQEARYRLKEGKGIRVFSKPDRLKDWLAANGLTVELRRHLITDAGQIASDFSLAEDGVEFFCHSPFVKRVDEADDLRNEASLIFNVRFQFDENFQTYTYDYLAVGDTTWSVLDDIVETTRAHNNMDRLAWDLYNIPHHCSFLALSDEKRECETIPKQGAKDILEQGKKDSYLVSSSFPISDTKEGREQQQPPHIQARKCYGRYLKIAGGRRFVVTMEEPNVHKPEPLVFEITNAGVILKRSVSIGASVIIGSTPPRAG
jgi:hypothetical protein